jgi:hypothetical protein
MDEDRADDDDDSDEDGINSDSQSNKNGNHNNDVSDISSELKAIQLQNDYNPNKTGKTMQQIFLEKPPNNKIVLLYGPIPGRQPSIFFNYPPFLKMQRPFKQDQIQIITQSQLQPYSYLSFKISGTHTYNCVVNAMKTAGFHIV